MRPVRIRRQATTATKATKGKYSPTKIPKTTARDHHLIKIYAKKASDPEKLFVFRGNALAEQEY